MTLLGLHVHHRAALEYDLQSRVGWGCDRFESGKIPWNTAWLVVSEILRDPYSHSVAAVEGYKFVPTPADVNFYNNVDIEAARNRGKNQPMPRPVKRPWVGEEGRETTPRDEAEVKARRDRLNAHFASK